MNSRTSRPRSPISAMTFKSAFVFLAIIPSNVLFPTPDPAKIPTLCPFPTVNMPSIALTPTASFSSIGGRVRGLGGSCSVPTVVKPFGNAVHQLDSPLNQVLSRLIHDPL